MLSKESTDLVRRDSVIKGLGTLLDPEVISETLKARLSFSGPFSAEIVRLRYRPEASLTVHYRLFVGGRTLDAYAAAYGPDASSRLGKALKQNTSSGPLGPGSVILEDIGAFVSFFPNDRKLKALRNLSDAESRNEFLKSLVPGREDLWELRVRTLKYRPERRYVACLETTGGEPRAVLRFYQSKDFARALKNSGVFGSDKNCRVPALLGHSDLHGAAAFEWLCGRPLGDIMAADFETALSGVADAGQALSELHGHDGIGLVPLDRRTEAEALSAVAEKVGFLRPSLAKRAKDLAERLALWLMSRPPLLKLVHGDFHAEQVLVAEDRPGIVDFDESGLGDPGMDIGYFIARMERDVFRGRLPAERVMPFTEALLEGYARAGGRVHEDHGPYAAIGLLRRAHHPFHHFEPRWAESMEGILERAEAYSRVINRRKFHANALR